MDKDLSGIRECPQEPVSLEAVLAAYEAETRALPLGAFNRERGDSTYSWRMSVIRDLRNLAARLSQQNAKGGPTNAA
jgi:hypothetical protein